MLSEWMFFLLTSFNLHWCNTIVNSIHGLLRQWGKAILGLLSLSTEISFQFRSQFYVWSLSEAPVHVTQTKKLIYPQIHSTFYVMATSPPLLIPSKLITCCYQPMDYTISMDYEILFAKKNTWQLVNSGKVLCGSEEVRGCCNVIIILWFLGTSVYQDVVIGKSAYSNAFISAILYLAGKAVCPSLLPTYEKIVLDKQW